MHSKSLSNIVCAISLQNLRPIKCLCTCQRSCILLLAFAVDCCSISSISPFFPLAITKQCCHLVEQLFNAKILAAYEKLTYVWLEKLYTCTVLWWWRNLHWTLYAHSSECIKLKYILGFSGIVGHLIISVNTKWWQGWEVAPRQWKSGTNHAKHLWGSQV